MTPEARRQYIAGNWKMYKTSSEAREYVQRLLSRLPMGNGVELALCVPFTALAATVDALGGSDVHVLAQNMHPAPERAQDAIGFIRALVGDRSEDAAQRVRVLYGGSVKPENAGDLLGQPDIDGALVGGASLDPDGLVEIVKAAAAA